MFVYTQNRWKTICVICGHIFTLMFAVFIFMSDLVIFGHTFFYTQ
jgi:hypothetical protein